MFGDALRKVTGGLATEEGSHSGTAAGSNGYALSVDVNRAALTHVSYEVSDGAPPTEALASVLGAVMCDCIAATYPKWEGHDDLILQKSSRLCAVLHDPTLEESLPLEDVRIVRDVALIMHDPSAALDSMVATDVWQSAPHDPVIATYARAAL